MHSVPDSFPRRILAVILCVGLLGGPGAGRAAVLTSTDGKTREFSVVVSADRAGLTVREAPEGKDIHIPWTRLDAARTGEANPWFEAARTQAAAGETVALNLGLSPAPAPPASAPPAPKEAEWRSVKTAITGDKSKNFNSLKLSAYVHKEVAVPRLAVVWVGPPSPLAKRGDAADLARRLQGALVVAEFEGEYLRAADGSGEALVAGVGDLLRQARVETKPAAKVGEARSASRLRATAAKPAPEDTEDRPAEEARRTAAPAIILMGRDEAAAFVWSVVCTRPADVVAAIMLNGVHQEPSTAGAFATPCLFLESPDASAAPAPATGEDLTRPLNLWRHFSTDGCRWCHAAPSGDPLVLAVAFARDVAAASPYVEALEMLESWQNNALRHRIPMPAKTAKSYKEEAFRLATPDGASVFPVASKTGAARNDLVWVPSAAFAARLAGK